LYHTIDALLENVHGSISLLEKENNIAQSDYIVGYTHPHETTVFSRNSASTIQFITHDDGDVRHHRRWSDQEMGCPPGFEVNKIT
jgi:hypothetical protein